MSGYDRTDSRPNHTADSEFRQIFIEAVQTAFRAKIFINKVSLTGPEARQQYADEIVDQMIDNNAGEDYLPRLRLSRECFTSILQDSWSNLEMLGELGGASLSRLPETATLVADKTIKMLNERSALALVKN